MKNIEKALLTLTIIFAGVVVILLGIKKVNYHCDEIWTYGLANNIGGINPSFEIGKTYQGMGPFEDFMTVDANNRFNYANTWDNQAKDVHPPFYYILVHTVCSLFSGTFSKWYGIAINIFWMTLTLIILYKLLKDILGNTLAAAGALLAYASSVVFFDTMLLIRMYAQFTFFVVLLMYVFEKNWDKKPDKPFLIKLGITLFLGMFTQYYFIFIAFFMCLIYGIKLLAAKDKKCVRNYIVGIGIAGICYGLAWYHILAHIFNGYRGEEAISKATNLGGLLSGMVGMFSIIDSEAFAGLGIFFIILGLGFLIYKILKKDIAPDFTFFMFLCGCFYVVVVGKICPKITTRYIMPVSWIFIIASYIVIRFLINKVKAGIISECVVIAVFCVISIFNLASRNFTVPMDYIDSNQQKAIEIATDKKTLVCVDVNWKILYDFVILMNTDSYEFIDPENAEKYINEQNEDFILVVNLDEGREELIADFDNELLYEDGMNFYYLVNR